LNIRDEEDTLTAENLKLWPMCLTKDASSSATADGRLVQSILLSSTQIHHYLLPITSKYSWKERPPFNDAKV